MQLLEHRGSLKAALSFLMLSAGVLLVGGCGGGESQPAPGRSAWNINTDFSLNSNPNGDWEYGYWITFGEPLRRFTKTLVDPVRLLWHENTDSFLFQGASVTPSGVTLNDAHPLHPTIVPPATFWMHPGEHGEYTVTQWTAPRTRSYRIRASFTGRSDTSTGVFITVNNTVVYQTTINGYLTTKSTEQILSLNAGQKVQFILSDGGNGWDFDSTSFDVTIDRL